MSFSETAKTIARYLAQQRPEQTGCYDVAVRGELQLSSDDYQTAVDELADYGLVGPALGSGENIYGCVALTEEGQVAVTQDFAPTALPLTPSSLAHNPLVATSWAIDRVVAGQDLPQSRPELAGEIERAILGLLPMATDCLPEAARESVHSAATALIAEVRSGRPRISVIRRALRVLGFPDGATGYNSALVAALPPLAAALDNLLAL
jgi:hypothetical protein